MNVLMHHYAIKGKANCKRHSLTSSSNKNELAFWAIPSKKLILMDIPWQTDF